MKALYPIYEIKTLSLRKRVYQLMGTGYKPNNP